MITVQGKMIAIKWLKITLLLTLGLATASCGSVSKLKHKQETKTDSSGVVKSVITTTITEKVDTLIFAPKDSLKTTIAISQLERGDTVTTESGAIKVQTFENVKTKVITQKIVVAPKPVHVIVDKTTTRVAKANNKFDIKKDVSSSDKTVKKTGFELSWKGWLMIICFILLILAYCIARKYLKFLP